MTTISVVENVSIPASFSDVQPTSITLLIRALVMHSATYGGVLTSERIDSSEILHNSIIVITDKFSDVRSAIFAHGGARRIKQILVEDSETNSRGNISSDEADATTGVVFDGKFRGISFDIPIHATSSGIDYIIPASQVSTVLGLRIPGTDRGDILFSAYKSTAELTTILAQLWTYANYYSTIPPIDNDDYEKTGTVAPPDMSPSTHWRGLAEFESPSLLAPVTYPWKAPIINSVIVTGSPDLDRLAPMMAFANLGMWDEYYGRDMDMATINMLDKPWLVKNKSSIGLMNVARTENNVMMLRNVINARYGAKKLVSIDAAIIKSQKISTGPADIMSVLSDDEAKIVGVDYARALNDIEALKNNKCRHRELLRMMNTLTMRKEMLELADEIEKMAMGDRGNEIAKCKSCHLNLICPHRLELYRLRAMNGSFADLMKLRKKWGTSVENGTAVSNDMGEIVVCSVCGDEFTEINTEIDSIEDYNGYVQNQELSGQLWGDISQLMRFFVVSADIGLATRVGDGIISSVKNQTYPLVEALDNVLSKTKSESKQEIDAKRIIYISIYDMVFLMLYARSNPTVLTMRGVTGTVGSKTIAMAVKLIGNMRSIQRNMVSGFTDEYIEKIMLKLFERYKNTTSITTLPRIAVNKIIDIIGLGASINTIARLAGIDLGDPNITSNPTQYASVICTYLGKRDRRDIEKSKNPYDHMPLVAAEGYAKKLAEIIRETRDASDGFVDFANKLEVSGDALTVASINEYIMYLRRGDYLNILTNESTAEVSGTLGLSAEQIEIVSMLRLASKALDLRRRQIMYTSTSRPWLSKWDPAIAQFKVVSEGIRTSYDLAGRKHTWNMLVLSNGETISRGKPIPPGLTVVQKKCGTCGLTYSEALDLSDEDVLVGIETANAADNFYQYYRLLCPEGERHTVGLDGKCEKCKIEPGTRDVAYAKKYRERYREDIAMSQSIADKMFDVKTGASISTDTRTGSGTGSGEWDVDDDNSSPDDIYDVYDDGANAIASKLKISPRLILHIGGYAKTTIADIASGKFVAPPVSDRNDARIANLRSYIANVIISYNAIINYADQIDDRGHMNERQMLRKMGYEKSNIIPFAQSLPSIIDVQRDVFGGKLFSEQFALVEKFRHPQKIHDYCLQSYCALIAYFLNGRGGSDHTSGATDASTYLEAFGQYMITNTLEWNSRSTIAGYFKWSVLYGDDEVNTDNATADVDTMDFDGDDDGFAGNTKIDTTNKELRDAAIREDNGGDPLGNDGFDVEDIDSDVELIHVGDDYGM